MSTNDKTLLIKILDIYVASSIILSLLKLETIINKPKRIQLIITYLVY